MKDDELLMRLQALEQRNADQDRNNALQSFINEFGGSFSNNEALGDVFYTELQNRLGAGVIKEINAQATQELVDNLIDDIDSLRKYLKRSARATEDVLDDIQERAQNIEKSDTKENNPVDTQEVPSVPEAPADSVMTEESPVPDMEAAAAPADFVMPEESPAPDMPAETAAPAPEASVVASDTSAAPAPEAVPPVAPVPPEAGPATVLSDERMKNIKAGQSVISKFINNKKEPASMKLDTSIISACGGN